MYANIRRYSTEGTVTERTIKDLKRRLEDGFLPIVQDVRGFHSYYALTVGTKELVTVGVFEDKAGATESPRHAADFVVGAR